MKNILLLLLICSLSFAEVIVSPNMNLPVPVVGTTPGPDWANDINSCMSTIDSHDHTPGHGVPISSSALSITSNLPLGNNSLTGTKAVVFNSQASFATNQSLYVETPDLFYNDGNGNVIRITQSGAVAGASGTITGLPSGTASASYQSVGGTFQFQSATSTPANGSFASVSLAQQTVTPNTITLKSPNSLGASYNVTFPTSVPSFTSLLTMSTSGVLSTVGYKAPTIQKFTSGSGTYTTPTGPGPLYIRIKMVGGGGGGGAANTNNGGDGGDSTFGGNTCSHGIGGSFGAGLAGGGGAATLGSGAVGIAIAGGSGAVGTGSFGNTGAASAFGGAGGDGSGSGQSAATNSGSGGGGSGGGGQGGGAGGYIDAIITSPAASYSYGVGSGGNGGAAGGAAGGAGGSGIIVIEELYQ